MLTTAELAAMRSTLDDSLPDECTIVTSTLVTDSAGGHTTTTTSATVACRLSPAGAGREDTVGSRVTPENRWTITVPYDTTVGQAAKITVGSRTFEVVSVDVDRSWDLCKRVLCVEVL